MITHVAIRFRNKVYSLPAPNRHHDVIRMIVETEGVDRVDSNGNDDPDNWQGFLDENGTYYNRKQALIHAMVNNQVKEPDMIRCGMLFSEDVW